MASFQLSAETAAIILARLGCRYFWNGFYFLTAAQRCNGSGYPDRLGRPVLHERHVSARRLADELVQVGRLLR
ncbi:hypothetical protein A4G28_08690 [Mycobacterium ostraviense]|uniref:Uncharacterized protein n=1 Tax=Mycobacterium ostraviense TaxID=2738409 RepID=A0A164AE04_9MYCO|nr:hypothetical protein A4G28_08690 [Mycobacterium ostraviense]